MRVHSARGTSELADVWTFGLLLFELFGFCFEGLKLLSLTPQFSEPFQNISVVQLRFLGDLKQYLELVDFPVALAPLQQKCLNEHAAGRPKFSEISAQLAVLVKEMEDDPSKNKWQYPSDGPARKVSLPVQQNTKVA